MAQQKLLMAYLKITSMGSSNLREEGKAYALVEISSATMRRSVRMARKHHLMIITIIQGTSSMIRGMKVQVIKEMADSSRKQGTPGMKNQMLFLIR